MVALEEWKSEDDTGVELKEREDVTGVESKKGRKRQGAKMLIVGAGARLLFYPTLMYNVVRNRIQPEFRWWDEIDQFLVLGAVPFPGDVIRLKNVGVYAVVTLNESYETLVHTSLYENHGINHLVIPTRDYLFAPSLTDITRAVNFIHEHALSGKRTYVHCKAGRGRSTTVVICYLMEYRGMSPLEAWQHVRAIRPRVLLAAAQWQAVERYAEQCKAKHISHTIPSASLVSEDEDDMAEDEDEDESLDLPMLVTERDLAGYRGIEDAGVIGNDLWQDIGLLCRLRLLASRNVRAWSKLSRLWIGTGKRRASCGSESASCKKMASSRFTLVPVYQPELVN